MKSLRTYGRSPFGIAVIHGGPGAPGEMAPVARELAADWGVLEPLQTAASLEGQIEEFQTILTYHGDMPLTLIGFSWGAWLSYIVAATYPTLVKKLVLVGSGSYEEQYTTTMQETRLRRLNAAERTVSKIPPGKSFLSSVLATRKNMSVYARQDLRIWTPMSC